MNEAHIHLMINHLPVIGLLIASSLLAFAYVRRDLQLMRVALWTVFLTALSTIPVYFSGEGAEEVVEHMPGISEALIEHHEELAEIALFVSQLTGLIALATILALKKSHRIFKVGSVITLVAALASLATMGLVANTGGKISHPELRDASSPPRSQESYRGEHGDDDD